MKKNMKSLKHFETLKANSLLESVIAIAIISVCSLVAFMIYVNVVKQNDAISYYEAKHKVALLTQETMEGNDYNENLYTFDGYTIDKEVQIRENDNNALLKWTIKTAGKTYIVNNIIPYYEQ